MEPIALSVDEAAKTLSIGKTKLYSEIREGRISAVKLGKRTIITRKSLDNYIANLKAYPSKNQEG